MDHPVTILVAVEEPIYPRRPIRRWDAVSEGQDFYRGLIKGYEEGLNQAWDDLIGLTTKGYSPREIQVMAKSKRQNIATAIRERKTFIKNETGIDLTSRSPSTPRLGRVENGNAYLIEVNAITQALSVVNDLTSDGTPALCILRSFPGNFLGALNRSVSCAWLTKYEGSTYDSIPVFSASEMGRMVTEVRNFMKEGEGRIVLLEGIEYLIIQNELNQVLKNLQSIVDQTVVTKGVLLLAIYPRALDDRILNTLRCNIASTL